MMAYICVAFEASSALTLGSQPLANLSGCHFRRSLRRKAMLHDGFVRRMDRISCLQIPMLPVSLFLAAQPLSVHSFGGSGRSMKEVCCFCAKYRSQSREYGRHNVCAFSSTFSASSVAMRILRRLMPASRRRILRCSTSVGLYTTGSRTEHNISSSSPEVSSSKPR